MLHLPEVRNLWWQAATGQQPDRILQKRPRHRFSMTGSIVWQVQDYINTMRMTLALSGMSAIVYSALSLLKMPSSGKWKMILLLW
jgi:hypothetical protein